MIGGGWEAQAAVGRDGRCKGEAQLAGGSEGRSNAVVHWTEADRLLIDRRKGIKWNYQSIDSSAIIILVGHPSINIS